jgi:hypothetical protein
MDLVFYWGEWINNDDNVGSWLPGNTAPEPGGTLSR